VSEGLPVEVVCRVVGISVSGFYARRKRRPSARSVRHAMLAEVVRDVHDRSRQTYGARRVHAEMALGRNMTVGRCTVELVMRRLGLAGLPGRPKFRKAPNTPTAEDLVNRDFARSEPNRLWLTDITEHPTREGKVYCAVVLDSFSRRVVGWSIDSSQAASLVVNALGMAIDNRQAEGTVIHSDHGTQFTSWAFTRRALDSELTQSMGTIGDCYDCEHDPRARGGRRRHCECQRVAAGLLLRLTVVSLRLICRSRLVGELPRSLLAGWAVTE